MKKLFLSASALCLLMAFSAPANAEDSLTSATGLRAPGETVPAEMGAESAVKAEVATDAAQAMPDPAQPLEAKAVTEAREKAIAQGKIDEEKRKKRIKKAREAKAKAKAEAEAAAAAAPAPAENVDMNVAPAVDASVEQAVPAVDPVTMPETMPVDSGVDSGSATATPAIPTPVVPETAPESAPVEPPAGATPPAAGVR